MKAIVLLVLCMSVAGCVTTPPGVAPEARVIVPARPELVPNLIQAYQNAGWMLGTNYGGREMVFERRASEHLNFWFQEFGAPPMKVRSRVRLREIAEGMEVTADKVTISVNTFGQVGETPESPREVRRILTSF